MATQLFFTNVASTYSTGEQSANLAGTQQGWDPLVLRATRGAGATNTTVTSVAGPTNGIEFGTSFVWITEPLDADITISGSITWNLRGSEAAMANNAAINAQIEVIDGATGTITLIDKTARTTELGTSESANNFAETPASGVACKRGDRLRVRVFADDSVDGNMGAAGTLTFYFNGTSAAATGDSYVTLTENLTFVSEPAATTIYPTDTASAVSTASVDREAWTSRGAGVQTDVTNTAAGWTAPIQVTDTAGGTVVDWFTKQLTAFTLGGAVRVNVRALESNAAANVGIRCEVARVASDGTSATTWAAAVMRTELGTTEAARSFLISGADLAISDGQRLRVRFLIDDYGLATPMAAGHTVTLYYAGTSGGASGDTYLTFTQTLTEYVAGTTVTPTTLALVTATFAPAVSASHYAAVALSLGPSAYYPLDEASGTVAYNRSGSTNGTYAGTYTQGAAAITSGSGPSTDFTSGYVSVADNAALDLGDVLSISALFKVDSLATWNTFVYKGTAYYVGITDPGLSNVLRLANPGAGGTTAESSGSMNTSPHHFVVTKNGTARKIWVDGVDVTSLGTNFTFANNSTQLLIGAEATTPTEPFNGRLSDVAFWTRDLSSGEVATLYAATSVSQTVTPTTVALTLATFAPTVTATNPQLVTPTTTALTLATFAPVVALAVTPTTVALTLTTFAPTVTATNHQTVTPTTAALALATFAATVTASDHKSVTPTTATLTLTAFAPVVALAVTPTTLALVTAAFAPTVTASNHQTVTPTTATLALTTFAATVSLSNNQSVTPTTASLTLATFAPSLALAVVPSTSSLTLATFAPTVSATANFVATPTTLALTLTTFAATVTATAHQTVTPTTAALVLTTQAPSVTTGGNVEFVPTPIALTLTTFAPTITGAQNVTVTPTTTSLALTTFAATVTATAHQTVTPTTKALTLALFTPAVTATDSKIAIPTTAALVTAKFAPTVTASNHQTATPTTKALTLATFAPTVSATAHQVATPTTLALTVTRFAPTVTASNVSAVTPTTAALTLTTFAPTVTAIANIVVTPTTAALTLTAYAPQLRQTVTPSTASLTLATFAPSANVSDNTYVVPGTLPLVLTGYDPDVVGIGPVTIVPSTAGLVLVGYAPLVFEAGPIDFIDGELVVADPVRGVLVVTSPHHGASVGANGRGRTTLVVTTPYIKGDVESN